MVAQLVFTMTESRAIIKNGLKVFLFGDFIRFSLRCHATEAKRRHFCEVPEACGLDCFLVGDDESKIELGDGLKAG